MRTKCPSLFVAERAHEDHSLRARRLGTRCSVKPEAAMNRREDWVMGLSRELQ